MQYARKVAFIWILLILTIYLFYIRFVTLPVENNPILPSIYEKLWQEINIQLDLQAKIKNEILRINFSSSLNDKITFLPVLPEILPILIFACDRETILRTLSQLIRLRPSTKRFPIYISLGCPDADSERILKPYKNVVNILKHTPQKYDPYTEISQSMWGYYKIAAHYKFGLNYILDLKRHDAVIIVEDDFDISPDFFDYFLATYPILKADPSIWCISAWNDNALPNLTINDPSLLYRTDFFPGLGWLLPGEVWRTQLSLEWPAAFWDDWMRSADVRKNRVCIRPELSRTFTFGRSGTSNGEFYNTHLAHTVLNQRPVFQNVWTNQSNTNQDITQWESQLLALIKDEYDKQLMSNISQAEIIDDLELFLKNNPLKPLPVINEFSDDNNKYTSKNNIPLYNELQKPDLKINYNTKEEFQSLADRFGLMSDIRGGSARTSYQGIVTFIHAKHRIFLVPADK